MTEIVAAEGYDAVKVRSLARLASVSSQTFYRHFSGKDECLLDAYDDVVRGATRRVVAAARTADGWEDRLRFSLHALNEAIARYPKAARLALLEAFGAGSPALERVRHTFGLAEAIVRDGFSHQRGSTIVESLIVKGVVGGVISVAQARLLEGRQAELPELTEQLTEWMVSFRGVDTDTLADLVPRYEVGSPGEQGINPPAPADVAIGDRELILAAAGRLARTERLSELTAPRICAMAGLPRSAFGKAFAGRVDCLLAAGDLALRSALERARGEGADAPDWPRGVCRAVASLCDRIAREPAFARLGFTEALTLGPLAVRGRAFQAKELAEGLRAGAPIDMRPTSVATEASIGAIWTILQHQAVAAGAGSLRRFAPTISLMVLAPAMGADAAVESIRREGATLSPA
jgi:AcrR family transcriptional regulator